MAPVENDFIKFWIEEDILFFAYTRDILVTLEVAKEVVRLRLECQKGKIYKAVMIMSPITFTPEARRYLAIEGLEGVEKGALVSQSQVTTVLGNFYMMVNKPIKPMKLFNNKEDAVKWLKSS
jgi:hypothetical protein